MSHRRIVKRVKANLDVENYESPAFPHGLFVCLVGPLSDART